MVMVMIGDVVRGALHNRGPSWCSVFDGGVEACHLFTCTKPKHHQCVDEQVRACAFLEERLETAFRR